MLLREKPYRGENKELTERKLKVWVRERIMACGTKWMMPGYRVL
jgi:hypothetical protein